MYESFPDYLSVSREDLSKDTGVKVIVGGDSADMARRMAEDMLGEIQAAAQAGRAATLIVPVGPVDQYAILATLINKQKVDCSDVCFINMDEYLTEDDRWVSEKHPLSFRGFMNRKFYDLLDPSLAPRPENRVYPDPTDTEAIGRLIEKRCGVDATYGGIGINGHIAFNEPPEPGEDMSVEAFAALPTWVLSLTRDTGTINSVTIGGEIAIIPKRAVTVGMIEILASARLKFYCNRAWQSGVLRRVLHGPITTACPASLLRTHKSTTITAAEYVADAPQIMLR